MKHGSFWRGTSSITAADAMRVHTIKNCLALCLVWSAVSRIARKGVGVKVISLDSFTDGSKTFAHGKWSATHRTHSTWSVLPGRVDEPLTIVLFAALFPSNFSRYGVHFFGIYFICACAHLRQKLLLSSMVSFKDCAMKAFLCLATKPNDWPNKDWRFCGFTRSLHRWLFPAGSRDFHLCPTAIICTTKSWTCCAKRGEVHGL